MLEFHLKRTGVLVIISAPSGGGKSTILRELLKKDDELGYSISATTRPRREGEEHGRDYFFYDEPTFERMVAEGAFYEWARVHGHLYGTLKAEVDAKLNAGKDVLLDIDVQGSKRLKELRADAVTIFILPPSIATLAKRLKSRGLDNDDQMALRLNNARAEMRESPNYDYVLTNRRLEKTISTIRTIIEAERHRTFRLTLKDALGEVLMGGRIA